jgi:DNA-binding NarL/FixJ family response regulator
MSQPLVGDANSNVTKQETILIVDAMQIRRSGIVSLLSPWAIVEHLRLESAGLDEVLRIHDAHDLSMIVFNAGGDPIANPDTLAFFERLRSLYPDAPFVVMSDNLDAGEVATALRAGAMGYLHTGGTLHLAEHALTFILRGGSHFPISVLRKLQFRDDNESGSSNGHERRPTIAPHRKADGGEQKTSAIEIADGSSPLTARQAAVLEGLCNGDSNKLIARRLSVSETTVKLHVRQIMRKLGAVNRTQAAVLMCQSTPKCDPASACNCDSLEQHEEEVALAPLELGRVAETVRARVIG